MTASRRSVLAAGLSMLAAPAGAQGERVYPQGRLTARPSADATTLGAGQGVLGLDDRDATIFVPDDLGDEPVPLILALHGFTGAGSDMVGALRREASARRFVVVGPTSRGQTWDLDDGPIGPDAAMIDRTLESVFRQLRVDPRRIGVLGFSDGASYALSTGMVNGDLFTHVMAFAPLRFVTPVSVGRPAFFLSSGSDDRLIPLGRVRDMAGQIEGFGYEVTLHTHRDGHVIDRRGLRQALDAFLA